jgi:hypothetical protein
MASSRVENLAQVFSCILKFLHSHAECCYAECRVADVLIRLWSTDDDDILSDGDGDGDLDGDDDDEILPLPVAGALIQTDENAEAVKESKKQSLKGFNTKVFSLALANIQERRNIERQSNIQTKETDRDRERKNREKERKKEAYREIERQKQRHTER